MAIYKCPNCGALDRFRIIDITHMDRDYKRIVKPSGLMVEKILNTHKLVTKYFKECSNCDYRTLHDEEITWLSTQDKKKYVEYKENGGIYAKT